MNPILYHFHPHTFEYLGSVEAQPSPLDPDAWLTIEGTTQTAPPAAGAHAVACYRPDTEVWELVPDFRGVQLYSTVDGAPVEISKLGAKPENTTEIPRPSAFHDWHGEAWILNTDRARSYVWERIKAERDGRKVGGINVGAHWFHSDIESRIQHLGLKDRARDLIAAGGAPSDGLTILDQPVLWKTLGGAFVLITAELSFDIVSGGANLDAQLFTVAEMHRAAMEASPDPADYDFSAGWPARFEG